MPCSLFAPPDWLLFVRQNTLALRSALTSARLQMLGEPQPIAEDVRTNENNGRSGVYCLLERNSGGTAPATSPRMGLLTWFDRSGSILGRVADSGARYQTGFAFCPTNVTTVDAHP